MQPKFEDKNYINDFLEEFYDKLNHEYLVKSNYCDNEINDLKNITCNNQKEGNITLLDMSTYNKIGNAKSFLNNGTIFWLNNKNEDKNYWYIDNNGAVGIGNENIAHNIRPIVTIKNNIDLIKGEGSKENPYIIDESNPTEISKTFTGEYIKYNDSLWRILSVNEKSIAAIKIECLKNEDECLNYRFGNTNTYLNSNIYKYLNETYYNSLQNKDFLIKDNFYNGPYIDYSYKSLKENTIQAYIGLPKIAEYYNSNNLNSYLITPNIIETIYTINENGIYYLVKPTTEKNIYPVINFDISLKITNGNGTIENPYELSR